MTDAKAVITDHVAIRVADLDRATRFYADALGARELTEPFEVSGALAEGMLGGPPGVRFRMRQIGFDRGVMELLEIPSAPTGRAPGSSLNVLHIGIQVDDVAAALARVLAAGGELAVPLTSWGPSLLCFCTDPDGTVLELADASIEELLVHTRAMQGDGA
jgi:catechol 2,3-dioxygenase-like lactoylglutathione lyase family enzyme